MNISSQTMGWSDIDISEGSKIQPLSSSEIEKVSGGLFPIVILGATITKAVAVKVVALAAAGSGAAAVGYYNNRR